MLPHQAAQDTLSVRPRIDCSWERNHSFGQSCLEYDAMDSKGLYLHLRRLCAGRITGPGRVHASSRQGGSSDLSHGGVGSAQTGVFKIDVQAFCSGVTVSPQITIKSVSQLMLSLCTCRPPCRSGRFAFAHGTVKKKAVQLNRRLHQAVYFKFVHVRPSS